MNNIIPNICCSTTGANTLRMFSKGRKKSGVIYPMYDMDVILCNYILYN